MKTLRIILNILSISLCVVSCEGNYYIENDLHGMWQVMSVERHSTDEVIKSHGDLYYMFQRSMVFLYYKPPQTHIDKARYIAHFDIVSPDSIGMGDFRYYTTGEGDFVNDEDKIPLNNLYKFGIFQNYTMFQMRHSRQELVLNSDSACVIMRKY